MFNGVAAGHRPALLKLSGEGLVQQRLLQRLQRGELPLVEAREALGFFRQFVELGNDGLLFGQRGCWGVNKKRLDGSSRYVSMLYQPEFVFQSVIHSSLVAQKTPLSGKFLSSTLQHKT